MNSYFLFYSKIQESNRMEGERDMKGSEKVIVLEYKLSNGQFVRISEVKQVSDADPQDLLKNMQRIFPDTKYLGVGTSPRRVEIRIPQVLDV